MMTELFEIGITRDFMGPGGKLTYKDIGLGLIEAEPRCQYEFLADHHSPVGPSQITNVDAVISLTPSWTAETFANGADRLLIVARFGVGYDMCDIAALTANNVLLTITPGATDLPVAGGVLAMMLALSRNLFTKDRLVRDGRWSERSNFMGTEIAGKRLGIVGFGGAGRELCRLIEPFGMRVAAYDPFVSDELLQTHRVDRAASLDELFAESDYVSIHCLLNENTRGMIDGRLIGQMKPTAFFLNAARGPIVVEADLIAALQAGQIAGAGLDVFEEEPPKLDNPLLGMDNVVLTPHSVCWTDECFQAIGESAVKSILSVRRGERPFGMINPEVMEQSGFLTKRDAMIRRMNKSAK
jgi:phosphoglycerate dehydrogenase-like enzyme